MTTPQQDEPAAQDQQAEHAAVLLAGLLVTAGALAAAAAAAGAAGIAGTAAQVVGAVIARPGRRPLRVAPAGPSPRVEALRVLVRLGADPRAAAAILAAFFDHPLPEAEARGPGVAAGQANDAALWRARYLVTATRRVSEAQKRAREAARAAGDDETAAAAKAVSDALDREKRYWRQHLDAERDRLAGGRELDDAATRHGPWLTWMSRLDERVTAECRAAHGHLFRVDDPPWIGLPGTGPHRGCRCYALGPTASRDGLTVNEALAAAGITRHDH